MADREPVAWITVNGKHVPIYEGESKQDAINRSIAKKNEDTKARQIAENKKQADKLNESEKKLPKNLYMPDIKAEVANETSKVRSLTNGKRYRFKEGTTIRKVNAFAGTGCSRPFRDALKYAKKYEEIYGTPRPEDWQHCAGQAVITNGDRTMVREVHWLQNVKDGKIREAFIKEYPQKLKKSKPTKS